MTSHFRLVTGCVLVASGLVGAAEPLSVSPEPRAIVERAIERGEIPTGSDPEVIMDLFYGPLYHRYLNGHLPLDDAFAKRVARMVAAAAADGAAA